MEKNYIFSKNFITELCKKVLIFIICFFLFATPMSVNAFKWTSEEYVGKFINRLYVNLLDRNAEPAGLNYWKSKYMSDEMSIHEITTVGFLHSNEFLNRDLKDLEYVKILYRTYLDREGESTGVSYWLNQLQTKSRDYVAWGFANSKEFLNILDKYHVIDNREYVVNRQWQIENDKRYIPIGYYGNLDINSVGIHIPLYNTESAQNAVDNSNQALFYGFGYKYIIADHAYQGFNRIANVKVGDIATITSKGQIINLICKSKYYNGINEDFSTLKIGNKSAFEMSDGEYIMYTCNGVGYRSVIITFWDRIY